MRFKISFRLAKPLELPIQYNHIVQAMIYDSIPDQKFREWLHQKGLTYGKRNFKMFTFSRLFGRFKIDSRAGRVRFFDNVSLIVSSAVDNVIQELGNGLLSRKIELIGQPLDVEEIVVLPEPDISDNIKIKMLSPVVAYRTEDRGEKKYTHYFGPGEGEFEQLLAENIVRKYITIFGEEPGDKTFLLVSRGKINPKNQKVMKYKGTVIKGWLGTYKIQGNPQLLKLAYDGGLGTKNAQGYGCFEVI